MSVLSPNPHILYREIYSNKAALLHHSANKREILWFEGSSRSNGEGRKRAKRDLIVTHGGFWPELFKPEAVLMEPVTDCEHFDRILENAKENSQPIVVDWMAAWCRKCIYLKPKLEKLASEYDTKLKFYCVDVNNVPQALVKRGNISKMPTIQLWKDGEMKAEVIGGHKAWLVIEEVRQMIQQFV